MTRIPLLRRRKRRSTADRFHLEACEPPETGDEVAAEEVVAKDVSHRRRVPEATRPCRQKLSGDRVRRAGWWLTVEPGRCTRPVTVRSRLGLLRLRRQDVGGDVPD